MKIQFNTGNFAMEITGEFSEDQKAKALESALKYIVQRDVASKVYISLAGVAGKKAAKVLPEGFERESVKWNAESAEAFHDAATAELAKLGSFKVSVTQFVAGEGSEAKPSKEAKELWTKIQQYPSDESKYAKDAESKPTFGKAMATLAKFDATLTEEDYDDERGVKAVHAYLLDAARKAKEAAKSGL